MPDITRMFRGIHNEFGVEVVFAGLDDVSPREAHPYDEYVFVAEGALLVTRGDCSDPERVEGPSFIHIPPGVTHVFDVQEEATRVVVMHPRRTGGGV